MSATAPPRDSTIVTRGGILRAPHWLLPRPAAAGAVYREEAKLEALFGERLWPHIRGKTVIDFGCGGGLETMELLRHGAARVIGIDIRRGQLETARARAAAAQLSDRCEFGETTRRRADLILSVDSFEHFAQPAAILDLMANLLAPGGEIWVSFGPTWYHPRGGHLFSFWPWSHLLFTERSLLNWRSHFRDDGARTFSAVAGGLNQMTVTRFENLIEASSLRVIEFSPIPIRRLRALHNRVTREFLTACVQCRLVHR